uniref:Uncharacterized protein n=1 Tax=Rhizophora mucronata TaxID=61149 RepID=A0A2P2NPT5_RHIMU
MELLSFHTLFQISTQSWKYNNFF